MSGLSIWSSMSLETLEHSRRAPLVECVRWRKSLERGWTFEAQASGHSYLQSLHNLHIHPHTRVAVSLCGAVLDTFGEINQIIH